MEACTKPPAPVCAMTSTLRGRDGFAPGVLGNAAIMASMADCGAVIGVELPTPLKVFACPGLAGGSGSNLLTPARICSCVNAPLFVLFQAVNQESNPDSNSAFVSVPS